MKKVPNFWWDMEDSEIIVESDSDKYPVVARFPFDENGGFPPDKETIELHKNLGIKAPKRVGQAITAIELAEKYIEDLKAGRITPKNC